MVSNDYFLIDFEINKYKMSKWEKKRRKTIVVIKRLLQASLKLTMKRKMLIVY